MTMTTMEATDRTAIMERMATTTAGATTANMVSTPATGTTSTTIRAAAWGLCGPSDLSAGPPGRGECLRSATASDRFGPALDFGLPDRHDPFDFVHRPLARRERLRPVDSRACDRDGIAADRDASKTVDDGHLRNPELFLRLFRERGQALDRHRPIDFVDDRPDDLVRAHRADEEDDRASIVPSHAGEDGLQVDPRSAHIDHRAPPLTGGRSATSSPSVRTRSAEKIGRASCRESG